MRLKIGHKLFLAMGLTTLAVLLASALLTRWSFQRGFLDYVNELEHDRAAVIASRLGEVYTEEGSWEFIKTSRHKLRAVMRAARRTPPHDDHGHPAPHHRDELFPLGSRFRLLDAAGVPIGDRTPLPHVDQRIPIDANGETVGYLAIAPVQAFSERLDLNFLARQTRSIVVISIGLLLFAFALAAWLVRQLVAPIRALAQGTRDLAAGHYETRQQPATRDELGELAVDFNALAETLQRNRRSQREWLADISHELRTPLAVLRAELQAVEDGVRSFGAETLRSLQAEVDRLSKLVDDLDALSRSDSGTLSYHKERVDFGELAARVLDSFRPRFDAAGIGVEQQFGAGSVEVFGDPRRLEQLLINLLENSVRYTDAGGTARSSLRSVDGRAVFELEDSSPGVPEESLPRLFDRLYRVERSRSRASGGAGLGLAIARNIVTAHGGEIDAAHSSLGGLRIRVTLPLAREPT